MPGRMRSVTVIRRQALRHQKQLLRQLQGQTTVIAPVCIGNTMHRAFALPVVFCNFIEATSRCRQQSYRTRVYLISQWCPLALPARHLHKYHRGLPAYSHVLAKIWEMKIGSNRLYIEAWSPLIEM